MSPELMLAVLIISMLIGLLIIVSTKEHKTNKKGLVKFVKEYDSKQKLHPHGSTDHFTHFVFDVDGHRYEKIVDSFRCDRQLRDQLSVINQEMEYEEILRTNLFNKIPTFYKVEVPYIKNLQ